MADHSLELHKDADGWDYGLCSCGWMTPPIPGADIVAEVFADHRLAEQIAYEDDEP